MQWWYVHSRRLSSWRELSLARCLFRVVAVNATTTTGNFGGVKQQLLLHLKTASENLDETKL